MIWLSQHYDGAKRHVVPETLADALRVDLEERGFVFEEQRPIERYRVDFGGMYIGGMPEWNLYIDGLTILGYAHQLEGLIRFYTDREYGITTREFADGQEYTKTHYSFTASCLVLTPLQTRQLIHGLEDYIPVANAELDVFWARRTER